MKVYKGILTKEDFCKLPKSERVFFIQSCNILNDINILQKIVVVSNNTKPTTEVETKAQNSQSLFFLISLTGKLYEAWELLRKNFFGAKLSKEYETLLSTLGQDSLKDLKRYFGKENLIKKVRNEIAFHYGSEEIIQQINELPPDEEFKLYLTNAQGTSFYYLAHFLHLKKILEYTKKSDDFEALDQYFNEVLKVAQLFLDFLDACLIAISKQNNIEWKLEEIDIPEPLSIDEVHLPYFVGKP